VIYTLHTAITVYLFKHGALRRNVDAPFGADMLAFFTVDAGITIYKYFRVGVLALRVAAPVATKRAPL